MGSPLGKTPLPYSSRSPVRHLKNEEVVYALSFEQALHGRIKGMRSHQMIDVQQNSFFSYAKLRFAHHKKRTRNGLLLYSITGGSE